MKKISLIFMGFLLLSGCGATTESGGIAGHFENNIVPVESNFAYTYRATYLLAALSVVAEQNIDNAGDARQAIAQINGISQTITDLFAMAATPCGAPPSDETVVSTSKTVLNNSVQTTTVTTVPDPLAKDGMTPVSVLQLVDPDSDDIKPSVTDAGYGNDGYFSSQGPTAADPLTKISINMGGQCLGGTYRTQFEAETARLDPQFFSLAAVSLNLTDFKALIDDVKDRNIFSALWDSVKVAWQAGLDLNDVSGVTREREQEWVYIQDQHPTDFKMGTFEEAIEELPSYRDDLSTPAEGKPWLFTTPMYALFKDVQQSCYNIQKQLPSGSIADNNCPRTFLPQLDQYGHPILAANYGSDHTTLVGFSILDECVSTEGVSITTPQTYYCEPNGTVSTAMPSPNTGMTKDEITDKQQVDNDIQNVALDQYNDAIAGSSAATQTQLKSDVAKLNTDETQLDQAQASQAETAADTAAQNAQAAQSVVNSSQ